MFGKNFYQQLFLLLLTFSISLFPLDGLDKTPEKSNLVSLSFWLERIQVLRILLRSQTSSIQNLTNE